MLAPRVFLKEIFEPNIFLGVPRGDFEKFWGGLAYTCERETR
jgi:hypothetical protein